MSQPLPVQLLFAVLFLAVLVTAAVKLADNWADYVVFAAFFLTFIGFAIAVNKRQYPTKKRGFTRGSDSRW
jgi:predicted tellurium resistance membrane protein TerC